MTATSAGISHLRVAAGTSAAILTAGSRVSWKSSGTLWPSSADEAVARRGQLIRRLAIRPSRSSKFIGPVPLKPSPVTVKVTV
jgi:hypothetical protein